MAAAIGRLGWRVYATNAPPAPLALAQAVLAYRSQYLVESDFGRLKGHPLSLTPMYLQRDDHATGLIRLLSIGLRVLTRLEFVVRQRLAATGTVLAGVYTGNPTRGTARPTTERLLKCWVRLNKGTETAIDRDDREIVRFLCKFSAKKYIDIETMFLAGKVGFCCFH